VTAVGGHLTTGWEPDLPVGDTLIRRYLFNHVAFAEATVAAAGGRVHRAPEWVATDFRRPAALFNSAVLLAPLEPRQLHAALDGIEAFFEGGTGTVALWSLWPTPDLRSRGWELEGHPPLAVRPPGGPLPPARPDRRLWPVRDAAGVRDWERVVVDGFPFPQVRPYLPGAFVDEPVLADDRMRLWLGGDEGGPVVAAALFVEHGVGQFAMGVTLPQARRQGWWAAMVRERLLAAPDLPMVGVFSDDSRPGAERYGFLPLWRFTLWARQRP
jgi:hypothetical protein